MHFIQKSAHQRNNVGFTTASVVLRKRNETLKITTGCKALDCLLEGGVETGSIIEVYGESGVGKSQFAFTLAVTSQLPLDKGGTGA